MANFGADFCYEQAKVAEKTHFAYSTPKRSSIFRPDEIETPDAPKQRRRNYEPRVHEKKLAEISVQLFA